MPPWDGVYAIIFQKRWSWGSTAGRIMRLLRLLLYPWMRFFKANVGAGKRKFLDMMFDVG
ncbi:MAG: hypothetical protein CO013_06125 [Syntrophobacterales bacterium CG_4_8_14_3_um_filter_58_8]|nr:MAG: hypothetical protein AUK26_12940 [Syntrophaceae bacterium CG2_30_58_14]PIV00116.1 MAG: hypothetical protein COS57_16615 [Syntrophobacterales bacterium CG03_land_8_20_14_0_80_58_14]PJC73772.1 MAG: hypothetical protein CO013_06125 [Syntrophobacterales bacterium CG_4_8_14_3_um_filter_58_8]